MDKCFNFKLTQKLYDDSIQDTFFDNLELIVQIAEALTKDPVKALKELKIDIFTYKQKMLEEWNVHECGNELKSSSEYKDLYYCAECGVYYDDKNNEVDITTYEGA
jgi:hypothetical protein